MECPGENLILGYLLGSLEPGAATQIESHIDECSSCRALVAALAKASMSVLTHNPRVAPRYTSILDAQVPRLLLRGEKLGRYVVQSVIGSGGMGIVYKAHDPDLDRFVALKLIRGAAKPEENWQWQVEAFSREAQAMARLSHPNVVTVFDVGQADGTVFIAMELIPGETLRSWLDRRRRSIAEILVAFAAAGRGLAAAHAAGVIHRDFKPQNVLMGQDGRVAVADFGLARRSPASASEQDSESQDPKSSCQLAGGERTPMAGTPAYMAPEQLTQGQLDERIDQYSFCLALFEGLAGHRPGKPAEVTDGMHERPADRSPKIPPWLLRLIEKGMSEDPKARYANMGMLVDQLTGTPRRRRRLRLMAIGAIIVIALGGVVAHSIVTDAFRRCSSGALVLSRVWSDESRSALEHSLHASGTENAKVLWVPLARRLDGFAQRWLLQYQDSCSQTYRTGGQTEETHERRVRCLARKLKEFDAVVKVVRANPNVVSNILESSALAEPGICVEVELLTARVPPPRVEGQVERIELLYARLAEVKAAYFAGLHLQAVPTAEEAAKQASAIGYRPLEAEALYWLGALKQRTALNIQAAENLERAARIALAGRDFELVARAWLVLIRVYAEDLGGRERTARATELAHLTEALIEGLTPVPSLKATLQRELGHVLFWQARYEDALDQYKRARESQIRHAGEEHFETGITSCAMGRALCALGKHRPALFKYRSCLPILERDLGPNHPTLAAWLNNFGNALRESGEVDEALRVYERALAMFRMTARADHPAQADCLTGIASIFRSRGQYDESLQRYIEARDLIVRTNGRRHRRMTHLQNNLGNLYVSLGRIDEARRAHQRALSLREDLLGAQHPETAVSIYNLAEIDKIQGYFEQALKGYTRAVDVWSTSLGGEHRYVAIGYYSMGDVYLAQGRFEKALCLHRRALGLQESILQADHSDLGYSLTGCGRSLLGLGRSRDALPYLERAWRLREASGSELFERAEIAFALAKALWRAGQDKPRALSLARRALRFMAKRPSVEGPPVEEIERWLATRQ